MHRLPSYTASRLVSRLEAKHSTFLLSGTADSFSTRFYPSEFHPCYRETRSLVTRNALVGSFFPPSWRPSPLHEIEWFAPAEEPSPLLDLPEINSYAKDEPATGVTISPFSLCQVLRKVGSTIAQHQRIRKDCERFLLFLHHFLFLSLSLALLLCFLPGLSRSESTVNCECRKIEDSIGLGRGWCFDELYGVKF